MDKRISDVVQMCCEVSKSLKIKVAQKGGATAGAGDDKTLLIFLTVQFSILKAKIQELMNEFNQLEEFLSF